jgi:hypothetical protein
MWANSVWGLLGFSGSSVYAMIGLAPSSVWQTPLRFSAVIFFLMSLTVLLWPLRKLDQRAMVWGKLQHPAKWMAELIEPIHIILLGLAVAFGGVIWQWRTMPTMAAQVDSAIQTIPGIGAPPDAAIKSIQWNQTFGTARAVDRVFALTLDGHGPASKSVKLKRAYLESAKTGEVLEMKVAGETVVDEPFPISEANPIPPSGFIRLVAKVNPSDNSTQTQYGLLNKEFIDHWGKIWFNAIYDVGEPDRISFDLSGYFPELSSPHVTRNATSVHLPAVTGTATSTLVHHLKSYTPADVRNLLDSLTEAQKLVDQVISPPYFMVENLMVNHQLLNGTQQFAGTLTELRDRIKNEVWPKIDDFVYKKNAAYKDEMEFAFALEKEATKGATIRKLDIAIDAIKKLPANPGPDLAQLVQPQMKAVADEIQPKVYDWIGSSRRRIASMIGTLEKDGTINYEIK